MARKPHNYAHFQNLVNELKEQNENNFAGLQTHLEVQTDVLLSMKGFMLKGVQQDQADLRREKEDRLEGKKKDKGLTAKSKLDLPRFTGKGFMGMLGNFLSTALIGIPGGLRKFLPAALGMSLIPKLAQGVALMVAGPNLIKALEAGFSQKTFSGGISAFMNSYFSSGGEAYETLGEAAAGGAGKGALLGFGLLGPRGAIIGGILGGALTGLNHIFTDGSGEMNSKGTLEKVKAYMLDNKGMFAGIAGALMGAKWGIAGGPAGIVAGAILGGGLAYMGAGVWSEMMAVEKGGEKDLGVQFKEGLKNWYMKIDWKKAGNWPAGLGGLFGAAAFSSFGPHGILAGAILGSAVGLIGGPILGEALMIDKNEGKGMADAMKVATGRFLQRTMAKHGMVVNTTIAGGVIGGVMGAGAFSIPGMIAGAILGAVFGVILTWIKETLGNFAATQFAKAFGVEKLLDPNSTQEKIAKAQEAFKKEIADAPAHTRTLMRAGKQSIPGKRATKLKKLYDSMKAGGPLAGTDEFDEKSARHAARMVDTKFHLWGKDDKKTDEADQQTLRLMEKRNRLNKGILEQQGATHGPEPPMNIVNAPQSTIKNEVTTNSDFVVFQPGLVDGGPGYASLYFR